MFGTRQNKKAAQDDLSTPLTNLASAMNSIEDSLKQDTAPQDNRALARPKPTGQQNIICKGTIIDGNLTVEGDLVLEGTVRGDVSTKSTLIVCPTAVVEGNIAAHHAEVAGRVNGTVQAFGLLIIKASGIIEGDVITKNLNVESGSTFNGRFKVGGQAAPAKKNETAARDKMITMQTNTEPS